MASDRHTRSLGRIEKPRLVEDAKRIAGFDLGKRQEFASAANVSGVRTGNRTFSRRVDSVTVFATDTRYGERQKLGAWTGADKDVAAACKRVLRAAKIPSKEVAGIEVLAEQGAVGERISREEVRVGKPELLRKVGRAWREVEGLPVWTSHLQLGLTRDGEVGQLELHWPRLTPDVLEEAHVLAEVVKKGFEPPMRDGATVEDIEAGVIHSPAIAFYMDLVAAVRVIYQGDAELPGKKPVLYLDRHADLVALPRSIKIVRPEKKPREAAG